MPVPPPGGLPRRSAQKASERRPGHHLIDAYLSHLAVERRLSSHTVESYGRDLSQLAETAAGLGRPVERLDRRALEQNVRVLMGEGRSPRSVARSVACIRGFYRYLVAGRASPGQPGRRSPGAARLEDAAEVSLDGRGRSAAAVPGHDAAPRGARSRADRAAVRHRVAGVGDGGPAPAGCESRKRVSHLHRQGPQAAAGARRRRSRRLADALPGGSAAGAAEAPRVAAVVRQRPRRRRADARGVLENPQGVRQAGRAWAAR